MLNLAFALSLLLHPSAICGKPDGENKPLPVLPAGQEPAWFKLVLQNGKVDEAAARAFVAAAEAQVLAELKAKNCEADPKFLALLRADRDLHAGTFAAVYPADGRIFQNLQQIWRELPPAAFQKYRHLALGASVLRREIGVGPIASPPGNLKHGMFNDWAAEAAKAGLSPAEYLARYRSSTKGDQSAALTPEIHAAITAFKAQHSTPFNEIWRDAKLRSELSAKLKTEEKSVPALIYAWEVATGIRPAKRSEAPRVSDYIISLAQRLETPLELSTLQDKKGQALKWPMFPVAQAPWPVLIGLGLTWPIDESRYVFDKLQGKHGDKRLHTYGPYRHPCLELTADSLSEIPWAAAAWPSQIVTGGVCGTMATLAAGTYISLGVPMFKTGQPRHGNLLSYRCNPDGSYYARVEQSATAGPSGTYTEWPFGDRAHPRTAFAECHYGLALAMNKGLDSWMRSRIALDAFRSLPKAQQWSSGEKILAAAIQDNPFNAELWYELADAAPDAEARLKLLDLLHTAISGHAEVSQEKLRDANADLGEEQEDSGAVLAKNVEFRTLVRDVLLSSHFNSPVSLSLAQRQGLLARFAQWQPQSSRTLAEFKIRYELSLQDPEAVLAAVRSHVQTVLDPKNPKEARNAERQAALQVAQLEFLVADAAKRDGILKEILARFTAETATIKGKKGKKLRPLVEAAGEALESSYRHSGKNKEAKALHKQLDAWQR
ncbi:MAG: hypothetical protein RL095_3455 [Verrucomicrobiota bacterium]|jgi:hypothetical protein